MAPTGATDPVMLVHGTAVALQGRAALLRGASGAGKSDLALRASALAPGAIDAGPLVLVADDQVEVRRKGDRLTVSAPPRLAGLMEVRGLGILAMPSLPEAELALLVDLVPKGAVDRLPDPWPFEILMNIRIPVLRLAAFEASAPLKLALALTRQPWRAQEG